MKHKRGVKRFFLHALTAPIIYSTFVPLIFFDVWIEIYHRICFLIYGQPYVKRSNYIRIDRHKLKYLNLLEKMNCTYCGYGNGLIKYWTVIFAKTEEYWCGIKHESFEGFEEPEHHKDFLKYGDEKKFKKVKSDSRKY